MTDVPRDYPFGRAAGEGVELLPAGQAEQEREDRELVRPGRRGKRPVVNAVQCGCALPTRR